MEELIIKKSQFGELRLIEINGQRYAILGDILKALGSVCGRATPRVYNESIKWPIKTNGGNQLMSLITIENALIFINKSRLPNAKEFRAYANAEF